MQTGVSMQLIKYINVFILSLLLSQGAHALPPKPDHCPSIEAIVARGVDVAGQQYDGWAAGVLSENYDTDLPFTFVVGFFQVQDEESAKAKAKQVLPHLVFQEGPFYNELSDIWLCNYNTGTPFGYIASAWTPANG